MRKSEQVYDLSQQALEDSLSSSERNVVVFIVDPLIRM